MESINDRLILLISTLKLSNLGFAKRLGMKRSTSIDNYTKGKKMPDGSYQQTEPGYDFIQQVIDTFNVNPYWINKGIGEMFEGEKKENTNIIVSNNAKGNIIHIPGFAQAGLAAGFSDERIFDHLPHYSIPGLEKGFFFDITVRGDSMFDTFKDGGVVVAERRKKSYIQWGEPYIVVTDDGILLKRLYEGSTDKTITMVSDNDEFYFPFEVPLDEIISWHLVVYGGTFNTGRGKNSKPHPKKDKSKNINIISKEDLKKHTI